jgi:hypothetical protein
MTCSGAIGRAIEPFSAKKSAAALIKRGASMRGYLGKLEVKSVREGDGRMPMQFAVPGVTGEDLSALQVNLQPRTLSYGRSLAKLPRLAPGDLDLAAVIELNV